MSRKSKSNSKSKKGANKSMDRMKYEIANEFGVNLGPDANTKCSGSVGGEMSKRSGNKGRKSKNNKSK